MTTAKSKTTKGKPGQQNGTTIIQQAAEEQTENHPMVPALSPLTILDKAIDKDVDPGKLKDLMDLYERWEASQAKKAFTLAFAKFQKMLPEITKEKRVDYESNKGGRVKYSFASLPSIIQQIKAPLAECGLTYRWEPSEEPGKIKITCFLEHIDGHSKSAWLAAPDDTSGGKNLIQAHGSTVSYLKRYTLTSVLGIGTADEDPDGEQPKKEAPKPAAAKQEPVAQPVPELSDEMQLVIAECHSNHEIDEVWKHNKQLHSDQSFNLAIGIRRAELSETIADLQIQWNLNASLHGLKKYKDAVNSRKAELGVSK